MKKNTIYKTFSTVALLSLGLALPGCITVDFPNTSAAATPATSAAAAPVSLAGKTLVIDHSQAQVAQLGMSSDVNCFSPTWQSSVSFWQPAVNMTHTQWNSSIPFKSNKATIGENTYAYNKVSGSDAVIVSQYAPDPEEVYPNGTMKLKFISPTEAEAQYISGGVDDRYFLRNVRVYIR